MKNFLRRVLAWIRRQFVEDPSVCHYCKRPLSAQEIANGQFMHASCRELWSHR